MTSDRYQCVLNGNIRKILQDFLFLLYFFSIIAGMTMIGIDKKSNEVFEQATLGAGCFWCVEAIFERLEGVTDVRAGYTGGKTKHPTYTDVCSGESGHVEVIQIDFNPQIVCFKELLDIFWQSHNPTTLNRQGADIGTQYRSAVFYHSDKQREVAEISLRNAEKEEMYKNPIVTEISPLATFYPAEEYHQDYYRLNSNAPYCKVVIKPKLKILFDSD